MNKLFPLYTEVAGPETNRPYFKDTWEPILVNNNTTSKLPPFQYKRVATEFFKCEQTVNGASTDITNSFRDNNELITSWSAEGSPTTLTTSGRNITTMVLSSPYTGYGCKSSLFTLSAGDIVNFRLTASVTQAGDVLDCKLYDNNTLLETITANDGKTELAYKVSVNSSDYNIRIVASAISAPSLTLTSGITTCQKSRFDIHNDYVTYYGANLYTNSLVNGMSTFKMQDTTFHYSDLCIVTNDLTYINQHIQLFITSPVDYADIYYKGGFIQSLYRLANVRRSPEPRITEIGEERDGILVKEKVITATKYSIKMKCSEAMLDALTTGSAATMTVTDQTAKTFTMENVEISKPDWYNTNGIVTITFDDNINIFTYNSVDL